MDAKPILSDRLQNLLQTLTNCKKDFLKEKENNKKLQEIKAKLENELKEARELEKSHRYHLLASREMVGNLQETVSELVHLKRDIKRAKEEVSLKDTTIANLDNEKENIVLKQNEQLNLLKKNHEIQLNEIAEMHENNIQQVRHEAETAIAQFTCVIEELRAKIKDMETEHRDKINVVVLEYEEKLQRSTAQVTQLRDQHAGLVARTDSNIEAYRRDFLKEKENNKKLQEIKETKRKKRLEDLEEKLKQSQFKHYLAQSTLSSQFESQVERPYSVNRDPECSMSIEPVQENPKNKSAPQINKVRPNTLQVNYYGTKPPNTQKTEKKRFSITKKRKLYNDKDFQDF